MELIQYFIGGAYLIQAIELIFFPLPSKHSTKELFQARSQRREVSDILGRQMQHRLLFLLTVVSVLAFVAPVLTIWHPEWLAGGAPVLGIPGWGVQWGAMMLITAGSLITLTAVVPLHRWVAQNESSPRDVYTSGLFSRSRNPISLGLILVMAGFASAVPTWWMTVGLMVYVVNVNVRVRMEEREMEKTFGEEYRGYMDAVDRWV